MSNMSKEKSTNAENKCYKCGEKGHFANKCFNKESKKENKWNWLSYHPWCRRWKWCMHLLWKLREFFRVIFFLFSITELSAQEELILELLDNIPFEEERKKYFREILEDENSDNSTNS